MRLVADSGGTTTNWYSLDKPTKAYTTQGCHPYYYTTEELIKGLKEELLPQLPAQTVEEVYFYGAGCVKKTPRDIVRKALQVVFPQARLTVLDDLLAAARATANKQEGICCILGTGSASLKYDGEKMVDQVPSLGYLLGDEGGGADLGRHLIRSYYYRQLPAPLCQAFEQQYNTNKYELIQALQQAPQPNRHLARYAGFLVEYQQELAIQELIKARFRCFFERQLVAYEKVEQLPIHFIGSVAYGFQHLLRQVLAEKGWTAGQILQSPFPNLLQYHQ